MKGAEIKLLWKASEERKYQKFPVFHPLWRVKTYLVRNQSLAFPRPAKVYRWRMIKAQNQHVTREFYRKAE